MEFQDLFDLSSFSHAALFEELVFPWEALEELKEYFLTLPLGKIAITIPENVVIKNPGLVSIEEGVELSPFCCIEGPCYIGKNSRIGHAAYLRPYSLLGEDCVVGHSSEIKHSILLNQAAAPHFNYVGNSILGNRVNLGAGVICANVKFNRKEISVNFEEKKHPTQMSKLGAIIGDDAQIGCQAVLNPGTIIKNKAHISPCQSVS